MTRINHRQRRGLSSVVGAVFMVLIMIGALNVVLLTMRQQDTVTQAVIDKSNANLSKLNEQIAISGLTVTNNNKLNMTITNSGGTAAKLASVYIVNETASPKIQYRFDLNNLAVDGRASVKNIGYSSPSIPFTVKNNVIYTVKVVTASGNSAVAKMSPLSGLPLQMALYVIPPTITSGQNVTLMFAVTNNATDSTLASAVSPSIAASLSCTPYPSATCNTTQKITATNNVIIPKGSTYLFKWVYNVKGPVGTTMTFNASLSNAKQGNYVIEKGNIAAVSAAQVANTFLFARLIQQPEIDAVFPSPFGNPGTASAQGVWGAIVSNPTEATMNVRKVVITVFSPRTQSQDQIIQTGSNNGCKDIPTTMLPASGTWSCPATNTLTWTISGSPLAIPAHQVQPFMVALGKPALPNGGGDLQSYSINMNVFTDFGQFAKTGYDGSMRQTSGAIANVYLSKAVASTSTSNIIGSVSVQQGQTVKVNATIADFDSSVATQIDAGSKLVIDIPQDFTNVAITSSNGFTCINQPSTFTDGSTQISCSLTAALTGAAGADAKTIQFTMTAPTVDNTKLYILYLLADGSSDNGAFTVGPVGENVIRVTP